MLTSHAEVHVATSLADALRERAAHPESTVIAGGTDVMVFIEAGQLQPKRILSIWGLGELRSIDAKKDGGTRVGALCTYADLVGSERLNVEAPTLVEAALTCGALQIRNRGTLGGNIANASPAGDTLPVLLALDAVFELHSLSGVRYVPSGEFFLGYRKLAMRPDELLVAVHLPPRHPFDHLIYRKVGTRLAQAISKISLGARLRIADGIVTEARIAYGAMAAIPTRCPHVEAALTGAPVRIAAVERLVEDLKPIDDLRSTARYRMRSAQNILRSWLETLA